jgi:hypothetical protein
MRVKITSDGTRVGTKIVDADTGEALDGLRVHGVDWHVPTGGGEPTLLLRCKGSHVELEGEAELERVEKPGEGDRPD